MDTYNSLKRELLQTNQDISALFSDAESITGMSVQSFADWQNTCSCIYKQMSEKIIRVAVVGPIKSGKSTFINSLFKGDYLKRGAGVVTSIITRVRRGKQLKAKLLFKSWDEVNSEIEQSLVLFPSSDWRTEKNRFDIRRKSERIDLEQALSSLSTEHLFTNYSPNINNVLLTSYIKGYEKVKDIISSDTMTSQYKDNIFTEHWDFVGDGSMAVYLRDIQLEIDSGVIDSNIEIADCQGSDSPNPLHLAMIQDYLILTHLIIYVISSRTGLREADIKFLSIIKKMGIMDNILFVINCDLSEHESINDLNALIEKVKEELSMIKPDPEIFSISALFNLFKVQNMNLSQKDSLRLAQWEKEKELTDFSNLETERFESFIYNKLTMGSYSLLLKNHLERLSVILSGMSHWILVNQNILTGDADSANEVIEKIKHHQKGMNQIKSMIKNTLDGSIQKIKNELKLEIDRYFDVRSGDLLNDIVEFVRSYKVPYQKYEENLKATGFSNTLYLIFQEFRQALDTYMAETINPEVIRFVREKENRIKEYLNSITGPFDVMVQDAIVEYNSMMGNLAINSSPKSLKGIALPDFDSIKDMTGLAFPPVVASMRYTAKIKTEAVMRLGFYTVVKFFKKLLKKPIQSKNEQEVLALKDGVLRMKRETEKSVVYHFKDYQENIKFQYIYKLIEAASNSLYEALTDRFRAYVADLSNIVELINNKLIDKQQASEILKEMEQTSIEIDGRINVIREKIELMDRGQRTEVR
ncbi:MAG: dynamin family protein [Deltaproteobacteria bacterium]|nr:dynamin family protein [Deltaproteobacteria bacterium]